MMNVFTANDLEAADLLALARYDDGAAAAVTGATGQRRLGPSHDTPGRHGEGVSRGVSLRPEVTDDTRLALARERFLRGEPVEPGLVRDTSMASWWRCREWHVAADRLDLSYVRDP